MHGGKTREKNGPIENKGSKQIGIHYVANKTSECGRKKASNKGCLIWQGTDIPTWFYFNKEMLNHTAKSKVTAYPR